MDEFIVNTVENLDEAITVIRDNSGKIESYAFNIKTPSGVNIRGSFSRDTMQDIYRLYTIHGADLTRREVSKITTNLSEVDFGRVLSAFKIRKASSPFAPHMFEEYSTEELLDMQDTMKQRDFEARLARNEQRDLKKTINNLALENAKLKKDLEDRANISIKVDNSSTLTPIAPSQESSKTSIMLHLADLHIGAKCESDTMYPNPYDYSEIERRLNAIIKKVADLGPLDTIVINLLGDMLDGLDNQTARRDHYMPQLFDNKQQMDVFINVMCNFINAIRPLAKHIKIYSVKCGNHDGLWGYATTTILQKQVQILWPEISFEIAETFLYKYEFAGKTFVITHGKDEKFMKRGLPVTLNDKTKTFLTDWLNDNNVLVNGNNPVHVIKADLHTEAINSCYGLTYRNVLSLFGASDYSGFNFRRNSYGASYELFIGDTMTRGTFENI